MKNFNKALVAVCVKLQPCLAISFAQEETKKISRPMPWANHLTKQQKRTRVFRKYHLIATLSGGIKSWQVCVQVAMTFLALAVRVTRRLYAEPQMSRRNLVFISRFR